MSGLPRAWARPVQHARALGPSLAQAGRRLRGLLHLPPPGGWPSPARALDRLGRKGSTPLRRSRAGVPVRSRREEGQVLLLGVGVVALVAALLLVVSTATSVYLDLKHLTSLADSAAVAAAGSVDPGSYYDGAPSRDAPGVLTDAAVAEAAQKDLAAQLQVQDGRAGGLSSIHLSRAQAQGSKTAVVTLTARSRPSFLPWGILPADGFTLTATGSADVTSRP